MPPLASGSCLLVREMPWAVAPIEAASGSCRARLARSANRLAQVAKPKVDEEPRIDNAPTDACHSLPRMNWKSRRTKASGEIAWPAARVALMT